MVFVFAPITSLTNTYDKICANATTAQVQALSDSQAKNLNTIGDEMEKALPKSVREAIEAFNKGPVAKISGFGGSIVSQSAIAIESMEKQNDIVIVTDIYAAREDNIYNISSQDLVDKINELLREDSEYFYNILPFTCLWGISDKWFNKFKTKNIKLPTWYTGGDKYFSIELFENLINNMYSSVVTDIEYTEDEN